MINLADDWSKGDKTPRQQATKAFEYSALFPSYKNVYPEQSTAG